MDLGEDGGQSLKTRLHKTKVRAENMRFLIFIQEKSPITQLTAQKIIAQKQCMLRNIL